MAKSRLFAGVLRIDDVTITQTALEAALRISIDRFEPARLGSPNYAQVDVPIEGGWSAVADWIEMVGPRISALRHERLIGPAILDLAVAFRADLASASIQIPSHAAEIVGRHGIDIEFSAYLTNETRHEGPAKRDPWPIS